MAEAGINGVLETILYGTDLPALRTFYANVIGLDEVAFEPNRHIFFRVGGGMLLIFDPRSTSRTDVHVGDAVIPRHGATGSGHLAFSIDADAIDAWRSRLAANGVEMESEVVWFADQPHVRSLYFRDPAGNSIELACPQLWKMGQ